MQRPSRFAHALSALALALVSIGAQATVILASSESPALIPDRKASGISSTLSLGEPGVVEDLTVMLAIDHGRLGDLWVTLSHGDTTVDLFRRVEAGESVNGLSWSYPLTFSGSARRSAGSMGTNCEDDAVIGSSSCKYTSFKPKGSFAAFQGDLVTGDWTLTLRDLATYQTGYLQWWSLSIDAGLSAEPEAPSQVVPTGQTEARNVPEPGSLSIVALALIGAGLSRLFKRRKTSN